MLWFLALVMACVPADEPEEQFTPSSDGEEGDDYEGYDESLKADGFQPVNGPLVFEGACTEGDRITIAAVGDVLLHGRLQQQAFDQSDRFISLWSGVRDLLEQADVTYANLEGPTAEGVIANGSDVPDPGQVFDDYVYTSYPQFNYHPSLIEDLMASGVDVVSTSNNHSLDRRALGADRTIEALERQGLPYTGTRGSDGSGDWYTFTETGGFKLAWLGCTYGTNGISDPADQVLRCFNDRSTVLSLVTELAGRSDVDAVIVTPHWGQEYQATPNQDQVDLAHDILDAGAVAVIASHPHVLQPWERYETSDGRETFVLYSLGNFVSGQNHLARRSTLLLYLGLTRASNGNVVVNGARYVPLHASRRDVGITVEAIDRVGGLEDSRSQTVGMFGSWNVHSPAADLVTDPQCDPEWTPPPAPHPHDGWIGGSCETDLTCGGTTCEPELLGGFCTQSCTSTCPDLSGRSMTFCVDLDLGGTGSCVNQCSTSVNCRQGYICDPQERYNDPNTVRTVCIPAQ